MIFLLSPAKALDYKRKLPLDAHTSPLFVTSAAKLIKQLKTYSPSQVAELMHLSDALAVLNVTRYAAWKKTFDSSNSRPAIYAFNGDVYDGLDAYTLDAAQMQWLQSQLCILSGLYGVLRPLDLMQAYRLEMGTKLANERGGNLVDFWREEVGKYLIKRLKADEPKASQRVVINLASQEYYKVINTKAVTKQSGARVIDCVFEESHLEKHKVVGFFAKRARGMMMRYAAQCQASQPEQLQGFDAAGYAYTQAASSPNRYVFRRLKPV